ncbi:MAG: T9SS type A sorting domain-containing protein [Crocinitomicaceae bacterium]|nr:T9SS type A sorting domain-containing protein [Crocinitomicaceae bacterium]
MKKQLLLSITSICIALNSISQSQIENSNFELWENVGNPTEEPINWNGFKTASGSLASFASQQLQRSTAIRPGASGQYCARIWTKTILGASANGTISLGRVNMASSTITSPLNHTYSDVTNPAFSETISALPDSIVFWAKYTPVVAGTNQALMNAILHDNYNFIDPNDQGGMHQMAQAQLYYPSTNGQWKRFSVPFSYVGPATNITNILLTFSTNKTPGQGSGNDEVLVDDVELIYNPLGINEASLEKIAVYYAGDYLKINSPQAIDTYTIYDINGKIISSGVQASSILFQEKSGMYFIHLSTGTQNRVIKFIKE